jgi:ABC-type molybdate transport system substrate-binding protein
MCRWNRLWLSLAFAPTMMWPGPGYAAELRVFSDGPLRTALVRIVSDFRSESTGNDVAAGQLTQIIANKTVQLVGPLPPEAQSETVYSAGAFSDAKSPDAAKAFVQFLASSKAAAAFVAEGAK